MGAGRGPVGGPKPKPADDSPALKDYEYNSKCNLINLVWGYIYNKLLIMIVDDSTHKPQLKNGINEEEEGKSTRFFHKYSR